MSRYNVSSPWTTEETFGYFTSQTADITDTRTGTVYQDGAARVIVTETGKPAKVGKGGTVPFLGESAWSDAARLLHDLAFEARR